jgi:hypothetical protein
LLGAGDFFIALFRFLDLALELRGFLSGFADLFGGPLEMLIEQISGEPSDHNGCAHAAKEGTETAGGDLARVQRASDGAQLHRTDRSAGRDLDFFRRDHAEEASFVFCEGVELGLGKSFLAHDAEGRLANSKLGAQLGCKGFISGDCGFDELEPSLGDDLELGGDGGLLFEGDGPGGIGSGAGGRESCGIGGERRAAGALFGLQAGEIGLGLFRAGAVVRGGDPDLELAGVVSHL